MRRQIVTDLALVSGALVSMVTWTTGCHRETIDKAEFRSAINSYLSTHHECVWPEPVKLPAQADTSKDEKTKDYDALTDAGLLVRTPEEKKRFLVGSKQVNDYDLSDKGHTAWQPDQSQPGYGNFCFGHFTVTSIDSLIPNDPSNPAQYTVSYRYTVEGIPDWANSPETRRAFPKITTDVSGQQAATATVAKSSNGWQVLNSPPAAPGQ